jgi:hypothetical protein
MKAFPVIARSIEIIRGGNHASAVLNGCDLQSVIGCAQVYAGCNHAHLFQPCSRCGCVKDLLNEREL